MSSGPEKAASLRAQLPADRRALLEQRIRSARSRVAERSEIPRLPEGAEGPLAFGQERLLFLHHFDPQNAAYNRPAYFRLTGPLDRSALERSLHEILRRHAALRARFRITKGHPNQVVVDDVDLPLQFDDLSKLPDELKEDAARQFAVQVARQPFQLDGGALVHARLVKLADEEHLLLLTFHHAVFDAWSEQVLKRELAMLYAAVCAGEPSPLPDLSVQYADFAAWQRSSLNDDTLERELAHWQERLSGAPLVIELPVDRPRSTARAEHGGRMSHMLPRPLANALRSLSQREEATLFMVLLAGFNALLHRCTGQEDMLIGTPVAGRTRVELEPLIGLFINMLPIRTQVSGADTFRELLSRVRSGALDAFTHQDLPFEKLVERLEPTRSLSHAPLVQVTFQLRNVPREEIPVPGLTITPYAVDPASTPFDLSMDLTECDAGLECAVTYRTDLFDPEKIRRLLGHYERFLEEFVANPGKRLSEISMLAPADWAEFRERSNVPRAQFPVDRCVHQLIERQAAQTPDAVAVTFEGSHLTYRELNARANQMARVLQARGAGPDCLVAIALDRSLETVVGIVGVLKSGAAYLPLDLAHPEERLRMLLQDAQPIVLLTAERSLPQLPSECPPVICLDADWPAMAREPDDNLPCAATPDNLAYVIYTSGSTGRPKGVMVEHRNVVRLLEATRDEFQFGERDVWTLFHSFAFDFSVWELFGPLTTSGSCVIVPRETAQSPTKFLELLHRERVTILNQTPSAFRQLDRADAEMPTESDSLALRLVIFGGEALEPRDLESWIARHGDDSPQLINMYGITETTVHVTLRRMTRADLATPTRSLIGVPIADLKVLLLDPYGHPVPAGTPGEIHVGGAGVARGYLNRPELTNARFPRDPFDNDHGVRLTVDDAAGCTGYENVKSERRLYRSGDLARRLPNGELEYLGRIDQQVQIRGFRVEPGEIDAALQAHPQIAEAATIARPADDGASRLIAYVVCTAGESVHVDELASWLRRTLPEYMIPSSFVFLKQWPLTVNGKLDRNALPLPGSQRPHLQGEFVSPSTPSEQRLAGIWSNLLGIESVGIHDNFFALGGHSLLASQMVLRARDLFSQELPLRQVFDTPTVAGLVAYLDERAENAASDHWLRIEPVSRTEPLPLSLSQEQFTLLAELHPDEPLYNESLAVRISGPVDFAALVRALNEVVHRHEILRTTIVAENGEFVQRILPHVNLPLSLVDLSYHPAEDRENEAIRLADEDARRKFDLHTGPIVRVMLFRLGDDTHLLHFTCHHSVVDRQSAYLLVNELAALHDAFRENAQSPLAPLPVQYADYAAWQRRRMEEEDISLDRQFWKRQLAGAPPLLLPTDRARSSQPTHAGARVRVELPAGLMTKVNELARHTQTTPFVTFLAAFKALLARYCRQEDVVVGTVISDREQDELRELIGCFLNTVVLRTDATGDPPFRELLGRVHKTTADAIAHRHVPFVTLVEDLQRSTRTTGHNPLFNVAFVLEPREETASPNWMLNHRKGFNGASKFDLMLLVDQHRLGDFAVLEFSRELFDGPTARRMLEHFLVLLEGALDDPDRPLSQLPLLTERERQQLLIDWNHTNGGSTAGVIDESVGSMYESIAPVCLHHLFETQAKQTPEVLAVVFEGMSLTYRDLNERANRLARRLISHGVEADSLVGLCVERSLDLIVGILGILKAGGAYVPLDPAQPAKRLRSMMDDCRPKAVVTQSHLATLLAADAVPTVLLDELDEDALSRTEGGEIDLHNRATPQNLAYVIYTSGSTGRPKGGAVEHRQIVNYVRGIIERLQISAGMSFATVSTIAADLGNTVIFPSLVSGGTLHVISQERASDTNSLSEYFAAHAIDVLKIVPSHLSALMAGPHPERLMPRKVLILGGEASGCDWVADLQRLSPTTKIFNHYGPTETTVGVLTCPVGREELAAASGTLPLGRPLPRTQAYILDGRMQPVPIGVPGELYIGGDGVARGYLNRPELTAASFIPDPFRREPGARLYRTGDRARYLADGRIEFLGRVDNQVKIRGFRIELGEIEAALREHPGVRELAVLAPELQPGDRRLAAYFVPRHAPPATLNGRRTYRLPNNLRVLQINRNETDYIYHEVFELQAYLKHGITLHDGDCVFDVGANIGLFTLFADRVCPNLRIHAFEPNPVVFAALLANAGEYGRNVTTHQFGLSDESRTAEFTFFEGFSLLSGYYADLETERNVVKQYVSNQNFDGEEGAAEFAAHADELLEQRFAAKTFTTELRTLSRVIAEERVERIDLLKINVEKSELDVLRGIAEEDWAKIAQLVVEVDVEENLQPILDLLQRQGYDVLVEQDRLLEQTSLCYVYAIRPSQRRQLLRDQPVGAHLRTLGAIGEEIPTSAELQQFLKEKLPDYMVPDTIVELEAFLLTANGKLDLQRLPAAETMRPQIGEPYVAPRTPLEELLAETWQTVLRVDRVGINDNFFELGGHSLLAMRVVARLQSEMSLDLPVRAMFESPTVSQLAVVLLRELARRVGQENQGDRNDDSASNDSDKS